MSLGAISLRNNVDGPKPQTAKAQSFGRKDHDGEHKSHKAAYIAGGVGLLAAAVVTAYLFRSKIAELPIFKKAMTMGDDVLKKTKEFGDDALGKAKKVKDNVVDVTQEFGQKVKEGFDSAVGKGKEVVGDVKNAVKAKVASAGSKKPSFTAEELATFAKFKKTGANQQGVFDTLKKYGMNESEEKYIKETLVLLKNKFGANGSKTKAVSMRTLLNESMKKGEAKEIIVDLLNTSKNIRKKWAL